MNAFEAVDIVFKRLYEGPLDKAISGEIYKHESPTNSLFEDVVINSLTVGNEQLQRGLIVVNMYVPNKSMRINGLEGTRITNHERLLVLSKIALEELNEFWDDEGNYCFEVQQHSIDQDELGPFLSIRMNFFNINITK
jgi:hypothetical protein